MGSCVSKKAARGGAGAKVAAPLPPEKDNALPPPVVVLVEEEVKEVLSETAVQRPSRPPEPEPEPEQEKVKRIQAEHEEAGEASDSVSVGSSSVVEKAMVKSGSGQQEVEKRTVDPPEKEKPKRRKTPDKTNPNGANNGATRSPSPAPNQRRQLGATVGEQPVVARPRREQPAVVSGIGCRSGRFSPSAARRAAESAVRRTNSAREGEMALPSSSTAKRSLNASIGGVRRDPGERSSRRPDSPARRAPASPAAAANGTISRQSSATRKLLPKGNTSPEQIKRQCGRGRQAPAGEAGLGDDELDEAPLAGKELKEAADGALGQNPSVAMECFIFL